MTSPLVQHFQALARYNVLANRRLYEICARLTDDEFKRRRPAFFGSIHGTLNHILVGDRIWLSRFEGEEVPSTGLDEILYEDLEKLRGFRASEDSRIERFVSELSEEFLGGEIHYTNNEGNVHADPVSLLVAHLFNHQTHHRGQVHDMITQTRVPPPVLDLHRVIRPDPE